MYVCLAAVYYKIICNYGKFFAGFVTRQYEAKILKRINQLVQKPYFFTGDYTVFLQNTPAYRKVYLIFAGQKRSIFHAVNCA
jgi:hypothetical protein